MNQPRGLTEPRHHGRSSVPFRLASARFRTVARAAPLLSLILFSRGRNAVRRCRGITLWELIWVLALVATLTAVAAPGFRSLVLDARRTADINAFISAIQLSRSEAAKRGRPVVLCKTADGSTCGGAEIGFDSGWMVFVNVDDIRPPQRAPEEQLLYRHEPQTRGTIRANRRLFEFRAFGWRSTNGTITFCDRRGTAQARAVIVSYTGRPRVSPRGPRNRTLACAALP